jgi:hypothetical protein
MKMAAPRRQQDALVGAASSRDCSPHERRRAWQDQPDAGASAADAVGIDLESKR